MANVMVRGAHDGCCNYYFSFIQFLDAIFNSFDDIFFP